MKVFLVLVLVLVLLAAPLVPAVMAYASCDLAAAYGWRAGWANALCFYEISADIIGGGGWEDW